jgi:hypothetical protein
MAEIARLAALGESPATNKVSAHLRTAAPFIRTPTAALEAMVADRWNRREIVVYLALVRRCDRWERLATAAELAQDTATPAAEVRRALGALQRRGVIRRGGGASRHSPDGTPWAFAWLDYTLEAPLEAPLELEAPRATSSRPRATSSRPRATSSRPRATSSASSPSSVPSVAGDATGRAPVASLATQGVASPVTQPFLIPDPIPDPIPLLPPPPAPDGGIEIKIGQAAERANLGDYPPAEIRRRLEAASSRLELVGLARPSAPEWLAFASATFGDRTLAFGVRSSALGVAFCERRLVAWFGPRQRRRPPPDELEARRRARARARDAEGDYSRADYARDAEAALERVRREASGPFRDSTEPTTAIDRGPHP